MTSIAFDLLHVGREARWIAADRTRPNNSRFDRKPLPVRFDWNLQEGNGFHSWVAPSGLQTEFSGEEPEECTLAEQFVVLAPGSYRMSYSYQTSDIGPGTGLRWQLLDARSLLLIAESPDLSSEVPTQAALRISVPSGVPLTRLRLVYRRALGTTRVAGALTTRRITLEGEPS